MQTIPIIAMSELVLLTGISGFIAKHIALKLLQKGYNVRGTIRKPEHEESVTAALKSHGADTSRLSFVIADLNNEAGWENALDGVDFVQHVASPFPIEQPRDREALVPAAKKGALRVLDASKKAEVKRIVFTSSMVAMMYRENRPRQLEVDESDWTNPEWNKLSAYIVSKTRAEQAAWEWAEKEKWKDRLIVVNPGFVLGPGLDSRIGTSLNVIQLIMEGAYPAVPGVYFPIVDVRDLADLHLKAMIVPKIGGRRLIGAGETMSMSEMARHLKQLFPDRAKKIPTATLPHFFVRLLSNFDRTLRSVTPDLGVIPITNSRYVTELTGVTFREPGESVQAAAQSLLDFGVVK